MKKRYIFSTTVAWVLYGLGSMFSWIMFLIDRSLVYRILIPVSTRLLGWSDDLDKAERIWRSVEEEEENSPGKQ